MANELVTAMTRLYTTIMHMTNDPSSDLNVAPEQGHTLPADLNEALTTHKTPAVVDLIRKLPYSAYRRIAPSTEAIDYANSPSLFASSPFYRPYFAWRPLKFGPENEAVVLPQELPLTTYEDQIGLTLVIDTETWQARVYDDILTGRSCPVHVGDGEYCPPFCRHQSGLQVRPAVDVINEWRDKFISLEWMLKQDDPDIITDGFQEGYFERVQQIFRDHGWPDNFRGAECQEAVEKEPYSEPDDDDEDDDERDEL